MYQIFTTIMCAIYIIHVKMFHEYVMYIELIDSVQFDHKVFTPI